MSSHFTPGEAYLASNHADYQQDHNEYDEYHQLQQDGLLKMSPEEQQQFLRSRQGQNHYSNSGLEVIQQESERSKERRQQMKEMQELEGGNQEGEGEEYDLEEDGDQSAQAVFQSLLSKISSLESDLIKERAKNLTNRSENLHSDSTQADISQIDMLRQQLRDKESTIQILTSHRSSKEGDEFAPNLGLMRKQISDLEEKLVKISMENERLNQVIKNQNKTIERLSSNSQQQYQSIMSEQVSDYMSKAEKLLEENETLSQFNEKLSLNFKELDEKYRSLQLKQSDKTEEIRSFWKEHFEKLQESMQSRFDAEKKDLQSQIERKTEQANANQAQLMLNAGLFAERSHLQSQIDAQILFSKNMDKQIKDYQQTIENTRKEVLEKQKRIIEVENINSQQSRKINELEGKNFSLSDQLKRMDTIEGNAHSVINENIRLQEIAERKSEETHLKSKLLEAERVSKESLLTEIKKTFENKIGLLQNNISKEREQWSLKEKRFFNELQAKNHSIVALNESVAGLEEERKYLLEKAEQLKVLTQEKKDLDLNHATMSSRKNDLETKLTQLVEQNKALNSNLESRLNEIEIWKERNALSAEEVQLLHSQYQQQIFEIKTESQQENLKQKVKFDTSVSEFQNKMRDLASQFNLIDLKKAEDERAMQADFKKKLDIERERFQISTEQTNLLKSAILDLEARHAQLGESHAHLERMQERKSTTIHSLEDELRKSRLESASAMQQLESNNQQLRIIRRDYDDLKRVHHMLVQSTLVQNNNNSNNKRSKQNSNREEGRAENEEQQEQSAQSKKGKKSQDEQNENEYEESPYKPTNKENSRMNESATDDSMRKEKSYVPRNQKGPMLFEHNYRGAAGDRESKAAIRASVESQRLENKSNLLSKMNDYVYYKDPTQSRIAPVMNSSIPPIHVYDNMYSQPVQQRNPFSESFGGSSSTLFPPRQPRSFSGAQEQRKPSPSVVEDKYNNKPIIQQEKQDQDRKTYEALLRDLEYYKSKEDSQQKLLDVLQKENKDISQSYKDLEKKYYMQNDWIENQYENENGVVPDQHEFDPSSNQRRPLESEVDHQQQQQPPQNNNNEEHGNGEDYDYEDGEGEGEQQQQYGAHQGEEDGDEQQQDYDAEEGVDDYDEQEEGEEEVGDDPNYNFDENDLDGQGFDDDF